MFRPLTLFALTAAFAVPALAQQPVPPAGVHIPAADYDRYLRANHTTQDIFYAYNVATATGRRVDDILAMRAAGRSWQQIGTELRVPMHMVYGVPSEFYVAPGTVPGAVAGERIEVRRVSFETTSPQAAGLYEPRLPRAFWNEAYILTPREFVRLYRQGFTTDEVYMIANAARATGLDTRIFADAIYRGETSRQIANFHGIPPHELWRVDPVWRTAEWASAIGMPMFTRTRLAIW
jgi:hypothetical protein